MNKIIIKLFEADIKDCQQTIKKLYLEAEKGEIIQLFDEKLVLGELQLIAGLEKFKLVKKMKKIKAKNENLEFLRICIGKNQIEEALKLNDLEKAEKIVLFTCLKPNNEKAFNIRKKKILNFIKKELNSNEVSIKLLKKNSRKKCLNLGVTENELKIAGNEVLTLLERIALVK